MLITQGSFMVILPYMHLMYFDQIDPSFSHLCHNFNTILLVFMTQFSYKYVATSIIFTRPHPSLFCFVDTVPHYVAQAGLKLMSILPQPQEGWDCRHIPPRPAGFISESAWVCS
jgi:hypothetical protein